MLIRLEEAVSKMAAVKFWYSVPQAIQEGIEYFASAPCYRIFILQSYINVRSSTLFLGYEIVTVFLPKHISCTNKEV